jgi:purine-binding chemotaxis protein CheW
MTRDENNVSAANRIILRERAARLARVDAQEPVEITRIVVFGAGGERYGLDIDSVIEIFRPVAVTPVPGSAPSVQGVTNLRGDIVTVINVAAALGLAGRAASGRQRIILAAGNGVTAGFLVDAVYGIQDIETATIDPPLTTLENVKAEHLLGEFKLEDNLVGLLNADNLLETDANA